MTHFQAGRHEITFDDCFNAEIEGAPHALLSVLNMRANLSVMHAWKNKKLTERKSEFLNELQKPTIQAFSLGV